MSHLRSHCTGRCPRSLAALLLGACILAAAVACPTAVSAKSKPAPEDSLPPQALEPIDPPQMPPSSTADSFTFVVLGNSAPPAAGLPVPSILFRIYDDIGLLRPDLVFHTGDFATIKTGDTVEAGAIEAQMDQFRTVTQILGLPVFVAPGSRDVPDEDAASAFRHVITGGKPYRSFDYGTSHFIVLSSEMPDSEGQISGDQMIWLQSDLNDHAQAKHTFVFINRTAYPSPAVTVDNQGFASDAARDAFTSLMSKYHVNTVFSGGQPMYSASTHDGVNYINTGGAGGATTLSPAEGGFTHYVLVSIDGSKVTASPIQPGNLDQRWSTTETGVTTLYNLSPVPVVAGWVSVLVPSEWRSKHTGLLGHEKLRLYQVDANTLGAAPHAVDAAVVGLKEGSGTDVNDPIRKIDFVYVRCEIPAGAAVKIKVSPVGK